jgi:hypothetical protein
MPDYLAAPRPATVALAQIPNSRFNFIDLHPSTQLRSTAAIRSSTAIASISALKRLVSPQTLRLRRANPHSARGTAASSPSRFPCMRLVKKFRQVGASFFIVGFFVRFESPFLRPDPRLAHGGARRSRQGWPSCQPCDRLRRCQATP